MTSGQGGNPPGSPYGPPEGWNAPPAPPQYPGYAPAPSAPTGYGAPTPVERPLTVRAGLGAFIGSMVLGVVSEVVTIANWREILDWSFRNAGIDPGANADVARQGAEIGAKLGIVVGLLSVAVYSLFLWFAWRGRNWARIVLWVLAGLGIVSGFASLALGGPLPFLTALAGFQTLLLIAAVVFLALKPSSEWYRFRTWQRANGQG